MASTISQLINECAGGYSLAYGDRQVPIHALNEYGAERFDDRRVASYYQSNMRVIGSATIADQKLVFAAYIFGGFDVQVARFVVHPTKAYLVRWSE